MPLYALLLAALATGTEPAVPEAHLEGIVENGTIGGAPVAGAEVVLRAGHDGAFRPVATTVTDQEGRFHFYNLAAEPGLVYLPGANRHGVHYPGRRVQIDGAPSPPVKLTIFDAVASPSPLIAERHSIDTWHQAGVLEVTETLLVRNPTSRTYVGEAEKKPLTTLSLGIPSGFERVTFSTEFFGRRFSVFDNRLVTDMPWLPGRYELKFTYHIPATGNPPSMERALDLPTSVFRVRASDSRLTCSLPHAPASEDWPSVFESAAPLAAGQSIKLVFGDINTQWDVHAKWMAMTVLGGLIAATALARRRWLSNRAAPLASRSNKRSSRHAARSRRRQPKVGR